jgi:hypothetical protein
VDIIPLYLKWERVRGPSRTRPLVRRHVAGRPHSGGPRQASARALRAQTGGPATTVYVWTDRRSPAVPRALIQRGDRTHDQCGQFSMSIFDGQVGLTVRFESEGEFRRFLDRTRPGRRMCRASANRRPPRDTRAVTRCSPRSTAELFVITASRGWYKSLYRAHRGP